MADQELQAMYDELKRRGLYRDDPEMQSMAKEFRKRGLVKDDPVGVFALKPKKEIPRPDPGHSPLERLVGGLAGDKEFQLPENRMRGDAGGLMDFGKLMSRLNSAKNAAVNEIAKLPFPSTSLGGIPRAMMTVPKVPGTLRRAATEANKALDSPKIVQPQIFKTNEKSGTGAKLAAKAGNFLFDVATDPIGNLLGGPVGHAANEGFVAARQALARQVLSRPAVQKAVEKTRAIVDPLKNTAAAASLNRGLQWFGVGPYQRMFKDVAGEYRQELGVQSQRVANVLEAINQESVRIQKVNPMLRQVAQDYAAQTKQNPVIELVRQRMQSLHEPDPAKAWETIKSRAKLFGVDPQFVLDKAEELRLVYDDAQRVITKATSGRGLDTLRAKNNLREQQMPSDFQGFHDDLARSREKASATKSLLPEEEGYLLESSAPPPPLVTGKPQESYTEFINNVLGEPVKQDLTLMQRLAQKRPKGSNPQTQLVKEAGVRNMIQELPTRHPNWVKPITDSVQPGWVAITEDAGLLGSLQGYQMPKPLHNLLQNEMAGASLLPANQIKSEYIVAKDVMEALQKNVIGQLKKVFIGQPQTQVGNLFSNVGQQNLILRETNTKVGRSEQVEAMTRGFKQAWDMERGVRSKTVEEISQHSPSLLQTQVDTALGRPSPEYGQLPQVVGQGRMAMALPRPQGLTARVFGEGNLGTAAATVGKAVGMVNPVEQAANFQSLSERATKIATYELLRKKFDAKTAVALTEKVHFDYTDRAHVLEVADKFGVWIFNTYPVKAFELFMDTVVNHPTELLRYARLRQLAIGDDDPSQNKNLPDWMRKSMFTAPIGGGEYVNVGRLNPFGGVIDMLANLRHGVDLNAEGMNLLDKTIASPAGWIAGGHQPFSMDDRSHPPLLQEGQPPNELLGIKGRELAKSYAPSLLGGRGYQAMQAARQGVGQTDSQEPRTVEDVALQYSLGLRTKKTKEPVQAMVDREIGKAKRAGPGGAAYAEALQKAMNEPTPNSIKNEPKYKKVDPIRDPQGFEREMRMLNGYVTKLMKSSQVVSKDGKVVGRERLENAARVFVFFIRRARGEE